MLKVKSKAPLVVLIFLVILFLGFMVYINYFQIKFVKNYTSSERPGLYLVSKQKSYEKGDLVLISFPDSARFFAKKRAWLDEDVPLLKRVAAIENDLVCHKKNKLRINGAVIADILEVDRYGQIIEGIEGCYRVPSGHFLPVNTYSPYSFDGRYFGSVSKGLVEGVAKLLVKF